MGDNTIRGGASQIPPQTSKLQAAGRALVQPSHDLRQTVRDNEKAGPQPAPDTVAPPAKGGKATSNWTIEEKIIAVLSPGAGLVIGIRKQQAARQQAKEATGGAVGKLGEGAVKAFHDAVRQVSKGARPAAHRGLAGKAMADAGNAVLQAGTTGKKPASGGGTMTEAKAAVDRAAVAVGKLAKDVPSAKPPKSPNND